MTPGIENQLQRNIVGLGAILGMLTFLTTALRILLRPLKRMSLGQEDWLLVGAQVLYFVELSTHFWSVSSSGTGQHQDIVGKDEIILSLKQMTILAIFYAWELSFVRLSICLTLFHAFTNKCFRILGASSVDLTFFYARYRTSQYLKYTAEAYLEVQLTLSS